MNTSDSSFSLFSLSPFAFLLKITLMRLALILCLSLKLHQINSCCGDVNEDLKHLLYIESILANTWLLFSP